MLKLSETADNSLHSKSRSDILQSCLCNSYTMGCPPVRGDNPRDYLTYKWTIMILLFYTTYISIDLFVLKLVRVV